VTSPRNPNLNRAKGATHRAVPLRESCCLVIFLKPKGEEAEPHMRRAKAKHRAKNPERSAGLLRGKGNGTVGRSVAEQERPSWVLLQWSSRVYKTESKAHDAQRESDEPIVPKTARKVEPGVGKGLYLDRASERR
jgi:hypothetical protein